MERHFCKHYFPKGESIHASKKNGRPLPAAPREIKARHGDRASLMGWVVHKSSLEAGDKVAGGEKKTLLCH